MDTFPGPCGTSYKTLTTLTVYHFCSTLVDSVRTRSAGLLSVLGCLAGEQICWEEEQSLVLSCMVRKKDRSVVVFTVFFRYTFNESIDLRSSCRFSVAPVVPQL